MAKATHEWFTKNNKENNDYLREVPLQEWANMHLDGSGTITQMKHQWDIQCQAQC